MMNSSSEEVGPPEDIILALLDFLVDPLLPSKSFSSSRDSLSLSQHNLVAKQVHAVVLLYNYYHRKWHPELDFMDSDSFCKMAVTLKPSLQSYLNLMHKADISKECDLEKEVSLTKKAIINACKICGSLYALKNNPVIKDWPVRKVAVFLVDSKKENCYLFHSSITQGVWSVIEKDVNDPDHSTEALTVMKPGNIKNRGVKRAPKKNQTPNEASLQQLALLAIKEACGINQGGLRTLENHMVYSIGKENTAVFLYIMQCTQTSGDIDLVPILDVIKSLQGPLVIKESGYWTTTSVVEYFHLLPYIDKVLDWLSREGLLDSSLHFNIAKEDNHCDGSVKVDQMMKTSQCFELARDVEKDKKPLISTCHQFETEKEASESSQFKVEPVPDASQCFEAVKQVSRSNLEKKPLPNTLDQFETAEDENHHKSSYLEVEPQPKTEIENDSKIHTNSHVEVEALQNSSHHVEALEVVEIHTSKYNEEKLMDTSKPSEVATAARYGHCNNSMEEPLKYSSLHSEAAKQVEVKHNSDDLRKTKCTVTLVYRRNRHKKIGISKRSGYKTSNVTTGTSRQQDDKCAVTRSTCMDLDKSLMTYSRVNDESKNLPSKDHVDQTKMRLSEETDQTAINGGAIVVAEVIDNMPNSDEQSTEKESLQSQTALKLLYRTREILSQQHRCVADDLALCESSIQTILDGGEENFAVKKNSVLESCDDICLRSVTFAEERRNHYLLDREFPLSVKRKRLSEANLFVHSTCQELDSACIANGWILPTYQVLPFEGGFQASVTLKGMDFQCSCEGVICDSPREARNSAAMNMLIKVRNMAQQYRSSSE